MAEGFAAVSTFSVTRRAADRLRAGHLWVYRSDLEAAEETVAPPGSLVTVTDPAGRPLGTALYSPASLLALRLVSTEPGLTRQGYLADVQTRVAAALVRRARIAPLDEGTDAQRLIFSEADFLPGIIADRYAELVVLQLLIQGTAQDDMRHTVVQALQTALSPGGEPLTIVERPDGRIRELEQLPPSPTEPLLHVGAEPASVRSTFRLNGLRFGFDAGAGQKTGAFLDQRLNYAAAAAWVQQSGLCGHALDVCTYQGGFALHLARVCRRVTGVDQSRAALEVADRNLLANPDGTAVVDWLEADAFELLRALDDRHRAASAAAPRGLTVLPVGLPTQFDAIVLDPPAFTKSRRSAEGALRGYKELNLRALRLLAPGGTLITCSCSHHVSLEDFTEVLRAAAADARRGVQLLETRAAAPDHPEVLAIPETRYLKCLICRVE